MAGTLKSQENTSMITKKICVLLCFQSPLCTIFFTKVTFIKELPELFKDFCRKFQDFSRISHNFSIFKHMMLFQGLFKARENYVISLESDKVRC